MTHDAPVPRYPPIPHDPPVPQDPSVSRYPPAPDELGDLEERDPGLARERTTLAWTRTALSFAAVGGVILKKEVVPGVIILCAAPAVWQLGRVSHHLPGRLKLVTATVVAVALAALLVAILA